MDELKKLGGKVDALKTANALTAKACADAALTEMMRALTEIDKRLTKLEEGIFNHE